MDQGNDRQQRGDAELGVEAARGDEEMAPGLVLGWRRLIASPRQVVALSSLAAAAIFLSVALFHPLLYHVFSSGTYLVLHIVIELASIVVSFGIFLVNWHAARRRHNAQSLFLGVAFLTVAVFDAMHILSFPGMPDFVTPSSTHKGIVYWLAARLVQAVALLAAAFIASSSRNVLLRGRVLLLANVSLIVAVFTVESFFPAVVPPLFVEGVGLTPLKVALEYLGVGISVLAIAAFWRRWQRHTSDESVPIPALLAAMVVAIFAELAFTLYQSAYDTYNLLGHAYKVVAYYLIFRALFVSSIERPYRDLARSEAEQARLYRLEARKAKELVALGRLLTASLSLDEVLAAIARAARELLEAEWSALLLRDGESLFVLARDGPSPIQQHQRLPAGHSFAMEVLRSGETLWTPDLRLMPEVRSCFSPREEARSIIAAPLKAAGKTTGVLEASSDRVGAFGTEHAVLLSAFADAAGVALGNARAHEEIQQLLAAVKAREERLAQQNEALVAQAEQLRLQNERIQVQSEEISAQNESLAERQGALERQSAAVAEANEELARLFERSHQQEAELRAIIDATADGILLIDREQKVIVVNPALESLTGYQAAEIVGRSCYEFLQVRGAEGGDCGETCPFLQPKGQCPTSADMALRSRDGRLLWVNVAYGPIYDEEERATVVVLAIRDISARKELEQQKDEFLSVIAHDLKTPLTAIKGYAQLLLRQARRDPGRRKELEGLQAIDERASRMADMINLLLDLTRIQMGRLQLRLEPISLADVAAMVVAQTQMTTQRHRVSLQVADQIWGNWDRAYLERVLANLVENAVKYSPEGGDVEIALRRENGNALVAVRDRGIGIAKDDLGRIFERYFRSVDVRGQHGLGLGLYIARRLVESHGGRLWAESEPGRGSTFFVSLPAHPVVAEDGQQSPMKEHGDEAISRAISDQDGRASPAVDAR